MSGHHSGHHIKTATEMIQLKLPLMHSLATCVHSTIQIPLHQNVPNNTSLLTIRTNLLPLQLLESRPGRTVGILAQRIDSQEAELARIVVWILFVAPTASESKPIEGVPWLAVSYTL